MLRSESVRETGREVGYKDGGVVTDVRTKVFARVVLLLIETSTLFPDLEQLLLAPFKVQASPELTVTGAGTYT